MSLPYEAPLKAPIRLSNLLSHYSKQLVCSKTAIAWELREAFATLDRSKFGDLSSELCRVGTVFLPTEQRGVLRLSARQISEYFDQSVKADGLSPEFIVFGEGLDGDHSIPSAAISLDLHELSVLLHLTGRPLPTTKELKNPPEVAPKGRELGSIRDAFAALMEIAATAALKSPDDTFCMRTARLGSELLPATLARTLINLAKELEIESLPSEGILKKLL